jgi:prolyl oligopeptidase
MRRARTTFVILFAAISLAHSSASETMTPASSGSAFDSVALTDPFVWLEDVAGEKALAWVREQNKASKGVLESAPGFESLRDRLVAIYESRERIPSVTKHGPYLYNFWRDGKNARGLWRRTTLAEYRKKETSWEPVLDLDKLADTEQENWVWKGADILRPGHDRALVVLSRGGADAGVVREFDLVHKQFVPNGFKLAEAKSRVAWRNRDIVYVGTDFGPGSLTSSGYPRMVKEWRRGASIETAKVVFEGEGTDVSVSPEVIRDHGHVYELIWRRLTFFTHEVWMRQGDRWVKIDKPADARVQTYADQILLRLRSEWTVGGKTFRAGSLIAADLARYLSGERQFAVLFEPEEGKALASTSKTKNFLILNQLENVRNQLYALKRENHRWVRTRLPTPSFGSVRVRGVDPDESDEYFMTANDFLTPSSLHLGTIGQTMQEKLKGLPAFFAADGLQIRQHMAVSKDGTKIPYFLVGPKGLELNGKNPTLLTGYGGFGVPQLPIYSWSVGAAWLERGGVFVLANIRGGGEFGPNWHYAARKVHRQRAYDDFIAVAEDLIARNVTAPRHLGIRGGSNGGLLVGVALTQRPDLFKAVVCNTPLLDMRRYSKLLAGASWIDEYGDPDKPEEWNFIGKYSPYHNVFADRKYPRVLFTTSTRDDRVHPGHARKMFARMRAQGHDVLFYENTEGGHAGSANSQQAAYLSALTYAFLVRELFPEEEPAARAD